LTVAEREKIILRLVEGV